MESHLNVILSGKKERDKRVFPRFPFSFLTFKANGRVFEVVDVSFQGIGLSLKNGTHGFSVGSLVTGELRWRGESLEIKMAVKWASGKNFGGKFEGDQSFGQALRAFLSVDNILKSMRPLHWKEFSQGLELPANLKYWLRADGPAEFFIWCHRSGEIASFQGVLLNKLLEWSEGKGIQTGKILKQQELETPLFEWDEVFFQADDRIDGAILDFAGEIILRLPEAYLPLEEREFLRAKLAVTGRATVERR